MEFSDYERFVQSNHRGVITTFQRNGAAHSSIVVCGVYRDKAAFVSVYPKSAKVRNLRRDPRCTVMAVSEDWRACVAVEGEAELMDYGNTEAETMRQELRDAYRACSAHGDHPNWEEFDAAMVRQEAVIVTVTPQRVYGRGI